MSWKAIFFALILLSSISIIPLTFAQVAPVAIFQSPKKQHEQGLLTYEVRCNDGLVLMEKKSDGSPACIKSQTAQKLYQRGWGDFMASPQVLNSNTENQFRTMIVTSPNAPTINYYTINYTITGGKLLSANALNEDSTVRLSLNSTSDGEIILKVPTKGHHTPDIVYGSHFFVTIDGKQIGSPANPISPTNGTLHIKFPNGTKEITINGWASCSGGPCGINVLIG